MVEIWNTIQPDMCDDVIHLMTHLADSLHGNNKKLILVIPPKRAQGGNTPFTAEHFDQLADVVDYFSLMFRVNKFKQFIQNINQLKYDRFNFCFNSLVGAVQRNISNLVYGIL